MIKKRNIDFSNALSYFYEKRMLKIFLLGVISGLPWVLIGSSLSLWLKEEGMSRSIIGWSGLIFSVYAINFLWAPFIDKLKIPILTNKIGHRKSWILSMQSTIGICLIGWVLINPNENLYVIITIGLIIAICSATQDITIDALRIEQIGVNEKRVMAAGASVTVVGWWTGYKLGGFFSLFIAEFFENLGYDNYWNITFIFLFILINILNFLLLFISENNFDEKHIEHKKFEASIKSLFKTSDFFSNILSWFISTILGPIIVFLKKTAFQLGFQFFVLFFFLK